MDNSQLNVLIMTDKINFDVNLQNTLHGSGFNCYFSNEINKESVLDLISQRNPRAIFIENNNEAVVLLKHLNKNVNIPIVILGEDKIPSNSNHHYYYINKPYDHQKIISLVNAKNSLCHPVAEDPYSKQLLKLALKVSKSNASVLISGESGVGKEVLARYIHDNSSRIKKPFVAINCAAIPENLLEASPFGYEKGSYTGAIKDHPGKLEQAQNGTLLLDEISEMSLNLQAKLLRVIQEKEVERIGSTKSIKLDVRVIATTNRNIQKSIMDGTFRKDLYYRLNVFPIHWVPLRERPLDIIPMAEYLIALNSKSIKRQPPILTDAAKHFLLQHSWPGNAREMDNVIQRALVLQAGHSLEMKDLILDESIQVVEESKPKDKHIPETKSLKEHENNLILNSLRDSKGNRTLAARSLKIGTRTLRYKIAKLREQGFEIPPVNKSDQIIYKKEIDENGN